MYKILLILLTSTILFADNVQDTFHITKDMYKKHLSFISKLKGIALVANKEKNKIKQISFSKEKNNTMIIYVSPRIQKEYPSILEGLEVLKKEEFKKSKPKTKKSKVKTTFYISKEIEKKYSELIKLIKVTESMDDDERQYWFDIMPVMTKEQIDKLYNILETERKKLAKLEIKYQKEIKTLNEKHLSEWEEFQLKKQQEKELNSTTTNYDDMIEKIEALKEN